MSRFRSRDIYAAYGRPFSGPWSPNPWINSTSADQRRDSSNTGEAQSPITAPIYSERAAPFEPAVMSKDYAADQHDQKATARTEMDEREPCTESLGALGIA
jgi:hypothetical protein